jgi:hypothetical protein
MANDYGYGEIERERESIEDSGNDDNVNVY